MSIFVYSDFPYSANASDKTKKDYGLDWIGSGCVFFVFVVRLKSRVDPLWVPCLPLLPARTTTHPPTYLPTYLSVYLPIYQSTRLPTCLHNYKSTPHIYAPDLRTRLINLPTYHLGRGYWRLRSFSPSFSFFLFLLLL